MHSIPRAFYTQPNPPHHHKPPTNSIMGDAKVTGQVRLISYHLVPCCAVLCSFFCVSLFHARPMFMFVLHCCVVFVLLLFPVSCSMFVPFSAHCSLFSCIYLSRACLPHYLRRGLSPSSHKIRLSSLACATLARRRAPVRPPFIYLFLSYISLY